MPALIPFDFENQMVRAIVIDDDPWFVASDVCKALDLANVTRSLDRLDPDEKGLHTVKTLGGEQQVNIVSEPGVYRLVFTSRKPEAERFKRWLAHEVLPSLRKTGRYEIPGREEPRRLTGEPIASLRQKIAMVREARLTIGVAAAQALWRELDLPAYPEVQPGSHGREEAMACLRFLVNSGTIGRDIASAFDGNEIARDRLMRIGIRLEHRADGPDQIWIANRSAGLTAVFAATRWAGNWRPQWKAIDGAATGTRVYKVDGVACAGWTIPVPALDGLA